jgi:hypothetical protein
MSAGRPFSGSTPQAPKDPEKISGEETMSFSLWIVIAEASMQQKGGSLKATAKACFFCNARADVGARVALLQSPILPAAQSS